MEVKTGGATDRGRKKGTNQDCYAIIPEKSFFIISDGMSGMDGGDFASNYAVKEVSQRFCAASDELPQVAQYLRDLLIEVSRSMWEISVGSRALFGMGATVVAIYIRGCRGILAHAGDSRAYLLREGKLSRLTEDHSYALTLMKEHNIPLTEEGSFPWFNQLTQHLGMRDLNPALKNLELRGGDRILMCTDGLVKELEDSEIAETMSLSLDAQQICDRLIDQANDRGGRDNISAIVLDIIAKHI